VHVPARRGEIHVTGELLNRSCRRAAHREARTERVPQSMYAALRELRSSNGPSDVAVPRKSIWLPISKFFVRDLNVA
jgi:hypothetical protein